MSKVAVVFWSGTGNTEAMANAVAAGAQEKGAEVTTMGPADFGAAAVADYDGIAFGCPAMGAEQLEEAEYQPMPSSSRKLNTSPCGMRSRVSFPERRLLCSVPMDGETASGCASGRMRQKKQALSWQPRA